MVRSLLSFTVLIVCLGCGGGEPGPKHEIVTGSVTMDGAPLDNGDIVFVPADGTKGPTAGSRIEKGKYKTDVNLGSYKVQITAMRDVPGETIKGAMGETLPVKENSIPAKYNTATELTAQVKGPGKPIDFALTK